MRVAILIPPFAFIVAAVVTAADLSNEKVITPFGFVNRGCVHYAPKGSKLIEMANHTELHHFDGRIEKFEACEPIDPRHGRNGFQSSVEKSDNGFIRLQGWIDYTGWYPKNSGYKTPLTKFTGFNSVPDTPANSQGQTLYWFIGMQNNEDLEVRILQPVLTYNGVGGGGSGAPEGWSFMSWNCCPSGQVWYSDPVTDLQPGDKVFGEIETTDGGNSYTIRSSTTNSTTELTINTAGLTFDWADVTLEVYSVRSCDMFPTKAVQFTGMYIESGGAIVKPDWTVYKGSSCNDRVDILDPLLEIDIAAMP